MDADLAATEARIRDAIRAALDDKGMSQAELARRMGISPVSLNRIIQGDRGRLPGQLMRVLYALGLDLAPTIKAKIEL